MCNIKQTRAYVILDLTESKNHRGHPPSEPLGAITNNRLFLLVFMDDELSGTTRDYCWLNQTKIHRLINLRSLSRTETREREREINATLYVNKPDYRLCGVIKLLTNSVKS